MYLFCCGVYFFFFLEGWGGCFLETRSQLAQVHFHLAM